MKSVSQFPISLQIYPPQISLHSFSPTTPLSLSLPLKPHPKPLPIKSHQSPLPNPISNPQPKTQTRTGTGTRTQDDGIPTDLVKTLAQFRSRHNYIRVLEVSPTADHPFAAARLLLLDSPGNIHSISFPTPRHHPQNNKPHPHLTSTYFDVFATLPPLLPPGPLGILGFGAGSAARLILDLYPNGVVHGWELDPAVIQVGREFFGLSRLEKQYPDRIKIYIGNAFGAEIQGGFSGLLVDLFSKGCLVPELMDPNTWEGMKGRLRRGGRIVVNVGGSCVEAEDKRRDGKVMMEECLRALNEVFPGEVSVLSLGSRKDDSSIVMTGGLPDVGEWKMALPKGLRYYADMWTPFDG